MENSNTPTQTQDPPVTEMPGERIERIARMMWQRSHDGEWPHDAEPATVDIYRGDAATAIAAMREPSEVPTQTQGPPATAISEAMVEAAARAMCAAEGDPWDELSEGPPHLHVFSRAEWRGLARAALIAGIAAALEEGR